MPSPDLSIYAPYSTTLMLIFISLFAMFVCTLLAAQNLLRENDSRFDALLYALPLPETTYLQTRFITTFGSSLLLMLICATGFAIGRLTNPANTMMNWTSTSEILRGLWQYFSAMLMFILPNTLFCTSVLVCAAAWTRNRLAIYAAGVFLYIGYMVMLVFSGSPLLSRGMPVAPELMHFSALLDPFGLSAFFYDTNAWSLQARNADIVPLSGMLLVNRLLYFVASCAVLVVVAWRFSFVKAFEKARRTPQKRVFMSLVRRFKPEVPRSRFFKQELLRSRAALIPTLLPKGEGQDTKPILKPSPLGRGLGEGLVQGEFSTPAFFKGANTAASCGANTRPVPHLAAPDSMRYHASVLKSRLFANARFLFDNIPLWLMFAGVAFYLSMEIYGMIEQGIRLPERYATTSLMVNVILKEFPMLALAVLLFQSSELHWRSRRAGFDALEDATPHRAFIQFCAEWWTLCACAFAMISLACGVGCAFQLVYGYTRFAWSDYAQLYLLLGVPLCLNAALMLLLQKLIPHAYAGLGVAAIGIIMLNSNSARMLGLTHPLVRFPASYAGQMSDMAGWNASIQLFWQKMLFAISLTTALILVLAPISLRRIAEFFAQKMFARGMFAQTRVSALPTLFPSYRFLTVERVSQLVSQLVYPLAGITLFGICALWTANQYSSKIILPNENAETQVSISYEKQYRAVFQNAPQPVITSIRTNVHLYPEASKYAVSGTYTLHNKSTEAISRILLAFHPSTQHGMGVLQCNGTSYKVKEGISVVELQTPLQSLHEATFTFSFDYAWDGFSRLDPMNVVTPNAVFSRLSRYFPQFGYQPNNELSDEKERKYAGLGTATLVRSLDAPRRENDFAMLDMTISTAPNHTALGIGECVRKWHDSLTGRQFFQYKTESPVPFRFGVSSAVYACRRAVFEGIDVEVYYHAQHQENGERLLRNAAQTLAYCTTNFGAYPYKSIRFAEISSFTSGFNATAYPATIFMNENLAFHSNLAGDKQQDVINELAGHELSHIWWGNALIAPDDREGASMLTETLAMYTELMLIQQQYGAKRLQELVRMHHDMYVQERGFTPEQALWRTLPENTHEHYAKGAVVMYQLHELLGEERLNAALRLFLQRHRFPAPAPHSTDFLAVLYEIAPKEFYAAINERFKETASYKLSVDAAEQHFSSNKYYELFVQGTVEKEGSSNVVSAQTLEIAVHFEDGSQRLVKAMLANSRFHLREQFPQKPQKIELDPRLLLIHSTAERFVKTIQ